MRRQVFIKLRQTKLRSNEREPQFRAEQGTLVDGPTNHELRLRLRLVIAVCVALVALASACQKTTDTKTSDENTLKDLDAQWSKAAESKDVDKTVSYYADGALVMPPNAPAATTKDAIQKIWKDTLTNAGFSGSWKATKVEVAKSGDLANVSGTWEFTLNDAKGRPATDRGKFLEVWKKQTSGTWKCAIDIWNSDLKTPEYPSKKKK